MKRVLQAIIGAGLLASLPQNVAAFDDGATLDRFTPRDARAGTALRELRTGGRIDAAADVYGQRYDRGGYRDWRGGYRYRPSGHSFVDVAYDGAGAAGTTYAAASGGGVFVSPSVLVIGEPPASAAPIGPARGGAKRIDVSAERLDRRTLGRDGIDVSYVGTAKIIRIAPDYRFGDTRQELDAHAKTGEVPFAELSPREQAVTVYPDTDMSDRPVDPPAKRRADAAPAAAGYVEPWSEEWRRDCAARHADFDASLGTYVDAGGLRRFCTGDR